MHSSTPLFLPTLNALPRPLLAALLLGTCMQGPAHAAPPQARGDAKAGATAMLEVSEDGRDVIDRRARLLWPRCVEGMHWNGKTCAGLPELFTHKQAQALAAERAKQDGVRWRLPRVNVMRRLIARYTPARPVARAVPGRAARLALDGHGSGERTARQSLQLQQHLGQRRYAAVGPAGLGD